MTRQERDDSRVELARTAAELIAHGIAHEKEESLCAGLTAALLFIQAVIRDVVEDAITDPRRSQ